MRFHPLCASCLLKRVLYEAELIGSEKAAEAVAEATRMLAEEYDPGDPEVSAKIAAKVHHRIYDLLGDSDPYRCIKEQSNRIVGGLLSHARETVSSSKDPMKAAFLASVAGNVLDFGIRGGVERPEEFRGAFDCVMQQGFSIDDSEEALSLLSQGSTVAYLTDNCGEIILDSIVWEKLRKRGVKVFVVVKDAPILTDATMEDVRGLGLESSADGFLTTGTRAVGLDPDDLPKETRELMRGCDLIISKGMANFEALSEEDFRPILYLMRTKCRPIAEHAGAPLDANIAKLYM